MLHRVPDRDGQILVPDRGVEGDVRPEEQVGVAEAQELFIRGEHGPGPGVAVRRGEGGTGGDGRRECTSTFGSGCIVE